MESTVRVERLRLPVLPPAPDPASLAGALAHLPDPRQWRGRR